MIFKLYLSKEKVVFLIWAFVPVILGGMIYVLWRPDTIRFLGWFDLIGIDFPLAIIRGYSMLVYAHIPEWIIFSLPNGFWAFSYAFTITFIWWGSDSLAGYMWLGSIPVVSLGYETMQYAGVIQGVFCYQDLFFCTTGAVVGLIAGANSKKRRKHCGKYS